MMILKPRQSTVWKDFILVLGEAVFLLTSAKNTAHECDHLLEMQLQFNTVMTFKMYLEDTYKDIYLLWQSNIRKKFFSEHLFLGLFLKLTATIYLS